MNGIIAYLIVINGVGLWSMWSDKERAIHKKYRISEKSLFAIAFLGGSIGSIVGMQVFRHKTKHWQFKYFMPAILIGELCIGYWISTLI